eukprot:1137512-Pelagomonas_calceolata.AAC.3
MGSAPTPYTNFTATREGGGGGAVVGMEEATPARARMGGVGVHSGGLNEVPLATLPDLVPKATGLAEVGLHGSMQNYNRRRLVGKHGVDRLFSARRSVGVHCQLIARKAGIRQGRGDLGKRNSLIIKALWTSASYGNHCEHCFPNSTERSLACFFFFMQPPQMDGTKGVMELDPALGCEAGMAGSSQPEEVFMQVMRQSEGSDRLHIVLRLTFKPAHVAAH